MSNIYVANILSRLFTYKTNKMNKMAARSCYCHNPEHTCAVNSIWNIAGGLPITTVLVRRGDLLLCVSVCGKQNYLHSPESNGKFNTSLSRNTKLFPLIHTTQFIQTAATYSRIEMGDSLLETKVHSCSS